MIQVAISQFAEKQLRKVPKYISTSLLSWISTIKRSGLVETRKLKGYHDEPLKGKRQGQRSIRLNIAYRAIYIESKDGLEILVIEVNKHEY